MENKEEGKHFGQHLNETICEECLEFKRQWSYVAGECSAISGIQKRLLKKAAEEFIEGRDNFAKMLREIAMELDQEAKKLSEKLADYIKRSRIY
jgi:hypothetical protein